MEGDSDLVGVRGWLLFFVIALALLSPLAAVILVARLYEDPSIALAYGDSWAAIETGEWGLVALSIAGAWFLAWRLLYVRNRTTVRLVVAGIWIIAVGGLLAEFAMVSLVADIPLAFLLEGAGPEIVRPFVVCTIWTLYFLRSRRVDNTYRRTPDEVAKVFG